MSCDSVRLKHKVYYISKSCTPHNSEFTCALWRLKSQAPRVFVRQAVQSTTKKISNVRTTGLCAGHPPATCGETLHWRNNEHNNVSNHQRLDCLLNCLFRLRSNEISKLRVTGLCEGNSPVTGEFPAQRASNAENVSIWWCHHEFPCQDPIMSNANSRDNFGGGP